MARQFIVQPMAGWVAPLPNRARIEIETHWPALPVDRIESAYTNYQLIQPAVDTQPAASEIEKRYTKLQTLVRALMTEVSWLDRTNLGRMVEQENRSGEPFDLGDTHSNLMVLNALLPLGRKYLPQGHQTTPSQRLAFSIGLIIQEAGLPVNARPKGPLCQVMEILLNAAGEAPSNVVVIVKPILAQLKKTDSNTA